VDLASRNFADVTLVAPAGRIDHPAAQALEKALTPVLDAAAATGRSLLLDFARIDYVSSMGLRVLMVAAKRVRSRGARIAVSGLTDDVAEIFAIARFDHVLEVHPSVAAALEVMSPRARAAWDAAR
jgi:anti-anti-sigma factor